MSRPSAAARYIRARKKTAVTILQELIAIPTVNPPGENYEACAKVLADLLKGLRMKVRILRVPWEEQRKIQPLGKPFPRYNVLGRWNVGAKRTLHFNAHYDVVPVSGKWKYGPFVPKLHDGWVYGRGSADMKGSIASFLLALESLQKTGTTPSVNIEVSFTADEETGGHLGAGYIIKHKLIEADYALVMEGGQRQNIGLGHNGVLWLEGSIRGKAAHGATPHLGINAFEQMNEVASGLFELGEKMKRRSFKVPGNTAMHPTLNIGGVFHVGSGAKINTVPAEAFFTIDRRLLPNEKLSTAKAEILAATMRARKKFPELKLEFKTLFESDASLLSPNHRFTKKLAAAVEAVLGKKIGFDVCCGFTDLHYFFVDARIPALGYGPEGENYHAIDERVSVGELSRTAEVYAELMESCGTE